LPARSTGLGIEDEIAVLYIDNGRPSVETRFVIKQLLLWRIYGLSGEDVCYCGATIPT
jgi:hypothetical protein